MDFIGRETISNLRNIIRGNILFFCQNEIIEIYKKVIFSQLNEKNVTFYTDITENPKRDEIQKAQDKFKFQKFDYILAFGGGSVIDFAKAFRFYSELATPIVAIPTTAGTGSQATQFAVVYIDGIKTSIDNPSILPDYVIVDSQFVENAPIYLKSCSAIDAYCQAIESFWAKKATKESKEFALEAIELCRNHIIQAVNSNKQKSNEMMAKAAHLAGKAINISRTTAAHALSYKITSKYGIPHGHAVALSISRLFEQNIPYIEDGDVLLSKMEISEAQISSYFKNLMKELRLEMNINKLGIDNVDEIIESVNLDRLNNNPKILTYQNLKHLFVGDE